MHDPLLSSIEGTSLQGKVLGRALVGKVPEAKEKLQRELTLKRSTAKGPAAPLAMTVL